MLTSSGAQEITLESLDNGPGLLPFRLGPATLITHYHTFLQYIEISNIENQVNDLQTQLSDFKYKLDNDTYSLYEIQIDYITLKISKIVTQLKSLEPNRSKRGIVDGLGSIIKSITGNLDYSDAVKFDNAIKVLENNQDKMSNEINKHVSISKDWMIHHNKVLVQLVENQNKINVTLMQLLDSNYNKEVPYIKITKFDHLLNIISENVDDIMLEIIRLENILSFVRASSTHHSIVSVDVLGKMIDKLELVYPKENILELELREYYDVIKPGYYYSGKRIVITLKFPVVSSTEFSLFRLAVIPNRNNQSIIPPYPLIASNKLAFMYIETECPKYNHGFLCEESLSHQVRDQADCIQNLIENQSLERTCEMTTIHLAKEAVDRLDEKHYVVSFPQPTKIHTTCEHESYDTVQGSYLVTIPVSCTLKTKEFTISNSYDRIQGQPLKIMKMAFLDNLISDTSMKPHLKLNTINLRDLHDAQDNVMLQSPIHLDHVTSDVVYHTTIPIYCILLGVSTLAAVIIFRRYSVRINQRTTSPETPYEDAENPAPATPPRLPPTFSLKVLK